MVDSTRLFLALAICLGLIVAGVGNVLVGSRRSRDRALIGALGVGIATVVGWLSESEWSYLIPIVGFAGLSLIVVSGFGRLQSVLAAAIVPFQSPRARWAAVAVAGVAGLGYELTRFDHVEAAALDASMQELSLQVEGTGAVSIPGVQLHTDRGQMLTPIAAEAQFTVEKLRELESRTIGGMSNRTQLIFRGPPSSESNCHGWVFTGGRYGVRGQDVKTILDDNGYSPAPVPVAGDLCVYRNSAGDVTHTAVVRAVCDDGTVLVEGKWGWMGVYMHPVGESCYGAEYGYYRTSRKSHLLADFHRTPAAWSKASP